MQDVVMHTSNHSGIAAMEEHSGSALLDMGSVSKKTDETDTRIYAYCPVPNCYKQWHMKGTPSLHDESIPLLPNGTINLDAEWPRRCQNLISAIQVHFKEFHSDEELPFAVRWKRFREP